MGKILGGCSEQREGNCRSRPVGPKFSEEGEETLKYKIPAVLVLVVFSVAIALAQTSTSTTSAPVIFGHGMTNYIPIWTGGSTLGNSVIFQVGGNVGVGTTVPESALDVVSGGLTAVRGISFGMGGFANGVVAESSSPDGNGVIAQNRASNGGNGIRGIADGTSGFANGAVGESSSPAGNGVIGQNRASNGGNGVRGHADGTSGFANGVVGESMSPGGNGVFGVNNASAGGVGVNGTTLSPAGNGVIGNNPTTTGGGGGGVIGLTSSADFGFSYAIRGTATASTGSALAIFGETFSPNGAAGYFLNRGGGDIIVGHTGINDTLSVFRVDSTGRVFADGGFQPNGADFAESLPVTGSRNKYSPGHLLVIDQAGKRRLALARDPYSTLVAGIYSTKPGMLGSTHKIDEKAYADEVPLAVVGIVPCKVSAENGPIQAGDLLVASATPGHAMKGTDRGRMLGAVVGKALEPLQKGTGVIQVLVTLQ